MAETEDPLLARARSGDQSALAQLISRHTPDLHRLLEKGLDRQWQSVLDVGDVLQVTFLEAFLRFDQFTPDGPDSFARWLTRLAQNNLRDALRDLGADKRPPPRARVESPPGDDSYVALLDLVGATSTTPSREAARHEIRSSMDVAIGKLPPDYERAVRLYDLEGRSIDEVAAAMGRSKPAVHMLRARAHDRLRELLGSASRFMSGSA